MIFKITKINKNFILKKKIVQNNFGFKIRIGDDLGGSKIFNYSKRKIGIIPNLFDRKKCTICECECLSYLLSD